MIKMYAVFDSVSGTFGVPVANRNDNEAVRGFKFSCSDPNISEFYLRDISLFCVGEFDELSGSIVPCSPRMLIRGNDYTILSMREEILNNVKGGVNNEISEKEN